MAKLQQMPPLTIDQTILSSFGATWIANGGDLSRTPPNSSGQLGSFSRFPHAVVAFLVAIPTPCLAATQQAGITEVLDRLARRVGTEDALYLAEAISLVVWDPATGAVDPTIPDPSTSRLRYERFTQYVEQAYVARYKGLPPHVSDKKVAVPRIPRTGAKAVSKPARATRARGAATSATTPGTSATGVTGGDSATSTAETDSGRQQQ